MQQHATLLGLLVQLMVFLWIIGLTISLFTKEQSQYWNWTKKIVSEMVKKQWKLILGIIIGWLLSTPGIINISTY